MGVTDDQDSVSLFLMDLACGGALAPDVEGTDVFGHQLGLTPLAAGGGLLIITAVVASAAQRAKAVAGG